MAAKKNEKPEPEKKVETRPEPPAEQAKPPKPKKARHGEKAPLPFLVDFVLSVSQLVILLVGIVTAVVSVFSGAAIWMAGLRSAAAMISIGFLFWAASWMVSRGALEATRMEMLKAMEEAERQSQNVVSTVEKSA
jgi:hypothetical protein